MYSNFEHLYFSYIVPQIVITYIFIVRFHDIYLEIFDQRKKRTKEDVLLIFQIHDSFYLQNVFKNK